MTTTAIASNLGLPRIDESCQLAARADGLIPAGTQTLAKGAGQYVRGVAPRFVARGKGARVWDVDGNAYLDFNMAIGPLVLGYGDPDVDAAIHRQLDDGITFSLPHRLEVEVAERIRELVPCAESVRFSKTGADVTSAAIRLARAFTGRSRVLCAGYHGWHDWYIATTDRHAGVPEAVGELTSTFGYNDPEDLEKNLAAGEVAAVILEPVVFEWPAPGFLERVRSACTAHGALLIFDEMWTGFRIALGGAQAYFGVTPDLATFSKAIANGMPLSVLAGRREIMRLLDRDVFFFTTFGGEALSLAAALATMRALEDRQVPAYLAALGARLTDGYNRLTEWLGMSPYTRCAGPSCRTMVSFDAGKVPALEVKSLVQQELIRRGILWSGTHTLCGAHRDEDIDTLLGAYEDLLPEVARAVERGRVADRLLGDPVEPVFRRIGRDSPRPRS